MSPLAWVIVAVLVVALALERYVATRPRALLLGVEAPPPDAKGASALALSLGVPKGASVAGWPGRRYLLRTGDAWSTGRVASAERILSTAKGDLVGVVAAPRPATSLGAFGAYKAQAGDGAIVFTRPW